VFFVLSKLLDVLFTPIAWASALILVGLTGKAPRRRWVGLAGVGVLVVFSLEPVANALWRSLESPPVRTVKEGATYDVVILLGGVTDERTERTWGQRAFNDNNERLLETYDLLRSGRAKNAILSGGFVPPPPLTEAQVLRDQLIDWGIDPSRLVAETAARNTHENAVNSAAIVRERGWQSVLVVTSAFHMPRALGCFRAEGLPVDALSVDFRSYGSGFSGELVPRSDHLDRSTAAIREWFGRWIYRLRGFSK
jgi:uncharacterized SAM-binding protein YcdF (DUF218 family)